MAILRLYQRRYLPDPEWVRKLAHIGGGLIALTLPHLFGTAGPVLFLCTATFLGLLTAKRSQVLREGIGAVVFGVRRRSVGELCFPLSIGVLFLASRGNSLLYFIPLLILTFADPAAGLVGSRYGLKRFTSATGAKSIEGSLAFFLVAFLSAHIPLSLYSNAGGTEILLIALLLSLVLAVVEAAASAGLDNLFLPVCGFLLLRSLLEMDAFQLALGFALAGGLVILVVIWPFSLGRIEQSHGPHVA